ncbi:low temperature requirement protein A [Gryllotalpicola protaetiae]|uniref:Low temperature requirement protein A n=1 Tax=Gryllotalpicola protaetiae TaxID=2419771 RepID=A0A387BS76_9MICO|nr:low temperature requirement protein A [Gryllotalpicola protaetiae]AYG03910.1 low temperature requirement protein A [Gryllotalpicola protaetiae]
MSDRHALREGTPDPERVTYVELFFDLVFAFAITQVSGVLGPHPMPEHLAEALVITLAVWWVWVYTTWATNWLNPDRRPILWLLLILTAIGLVISEAIPEAFNSKAPLFVAGYLAFGAVRTVGVIAATRRRAPEIARGQLRILAWSGAAAVAWISGALAPDERGRLLLWALAVLLEYTGPASLFWVPGRGRSGWDSWKIRGGHFSERSALFVIIVLGESILVIGRALSEERAGAGVVSAAFCAFASAVLMWFLYFAHGQEYGRRFISARPVTGPVARVSYTYLHAVLVVGLVFATHGSELALEAPREPADAMFDLLMVGGTALYLLGLLSFKASVGVRLRSVPGHIVGAFLLLPVLLIAALGSTKPSRLTLAVSVTAILGAVVAADEYFWVQRQRPSRETTTEHG